MATNPQYTSRIHSHYTLSTQIITVKGMLRTTVRGVVRINGKCIVTFMVIITVMGIVIHFYLYSHFASVKPLRPATNRAATDAISNLTCLDMFS